jgi:putative ABC transport system permease protein
MPITDLTIIRRSLLARSFMTFTTVLTVAVAVGLMLVLIGMKDAGFRAFERGSGNMHLIVSRDSSPLVSVLNGVFYANPPRRPIEWAKYEALAAQYPLDYAVPVQQGDSYRGFPVLASTPEFFTDFSPDPRPGVTWQLVEGRFFTRPFEVVLGAEVARSTGLVIGDEVLVAHGIGAGVPEGGERRKADAPDEDDHAHDDHDHDDDHAHDDHDHDDDHAHDDHDDDHDHAHDDHDHDDHDHDDDHAHDDHEDDHAHDDDGHEHHGPGHVHDEFAFEVVGILERTGGPHDRALFVDLTSSWILHAHDRREREDPSVAHTDASHLTDADRLITGIYLRVASREGRMMAGGLPEVFDALRRDTTITVAQPDRQVATLFTIVSNVDRIVIGMAAVVMVASGIAIMLALYSSMEQRRRQIAVLRVLGLSRGRIFGLVLTESAVIGMIGAVVGAVLAIGGGRIVASAMKARLGLVIEPTVFSEWTLVVILVTVAMAALAGLVPALLAYRVPVARHLAPLG